MSRTGGRQWGRPRVENRRNDRLANLDPLEFERVVADYYRRQGYSVVHCGTGGGQRRFDGGIDLKMYRDGRYTIVQCKRENALQVTHNVGHELLGILATEKADHAIVVNAGEFTRHARESAAKDDRLQLIDGNEVREMLPEYAVAVASDGEPQGAAGPMNVSLGERWEGALSVPSMPTASTAVSSVHGDEWATRPVRRRRSLDRADFKAGLAIAVLAALVLWRCSSSAPERRVVVLPPVDANPKREEPANLPAASAVPPKHVPEAPRRVYSESELQEQTRLADEAMKVIEATTPEM